MMCNEVEKTMHYQYPFGQEVRRLVQEDQTPKKVFVLGVYASAVHARWTRDGKTVCNALAVASEPRIFWDGNEEEARRTLSAIRIPEEVGELRLSQSNMNGPSAKALDEQILAPLGFSRQDAWLCDLLPESRLNPTQQNVITERYNPLIERYSLNPVTVPTEDGKFCDEGRRKEITAEILKSEAETLILLGDMPIRQYLRHAAGVNIQNLREFTQKYGYGMTQPVEIARKKLNLLPLAHPRQISQLGRSSAEWFEAHQKWRTHLAY
jgi:hypothetical protein